jgi:protein-S-isoprenylcysteine O-methyltransferase Ste14
MIAWLNLIFLIVTAVLTLVYYVKSVGPAQLEKKIGEKAYKQCEQYRLVCSAFMFLHVGGYIVYYFYPVPLGLAKTFPWSYWVSVMIAVIIAIPSGYVMYRGAKDAGKETMQPRKEHTLYKGIYNKIRHPQAIGELPMFWVIAVLIHSPFMVIFTVIWIPIFYWMCVAEEKDLVIRYGQPYIEYKQKTGMFFPKGK